MFKCKGKRKLRFRALSQAGHAGKRSKSVTGAESGAAENSAPQEETAASGAESGPIAEPQEPSSTTDAPSSEETTDFSSDTEYKPSPDKIHLLHRDKVLTAVMPTETVKIQDRFYMGQSACISNFVENINSTSSCNTEGCHGILVPLKSSSLGLGGSMKVDYSCNGCTQRLVSFDSSMYIEGSRRTVVGLALHVAQFISGHHYSDIFRSLGICLGMNVLAGQTFQNIIKLLYPIVRDMVDEVCESAKDEMKALPDDQIGSWKRAITTSDGAWLNRGSFSKNFSFTVRNFCNNSLLYYVHLCQRGNGGIDEPLYPGTSKSAEGYAAERCFQQAKEEEMNVEVNWQDNDSSSIKSFKTVFPGDENKVMFCGGHVTRAHTNQLHKLSAMKSATSAFISRHGKTYPSIAKLECTCQKRHSPNCGCMSDKFIRQARVNHSCAILEGHHAKDPNKYREILQQLGKHHCRNVHVWKGGHCSFHPLTVCSCNKCDEKKDPSYKGKMYESKTFLSCEFHALLYEIEVNERSHMADQIIHPEIGKGHSNFPEASHSVWTKFRAKNSNIQKLHYIVSTNFGLLQSNLSWLNSKRGLSYHWILDLYSRLSLPVLPSIREACMKANEVRQASLNYKATQHAKDLRVHRKQGRVMEQEERKQWVKQQAVRHTYGDDDDDGGDETDEEGVNLVQSDNQSNVEGEVLVSNTGNGGGQATGKKKCKCGSTSHQRVSHKDCPLRRKV